MKVRQTVDVVQLQLARLKNDAVEKQRLVLLWLPRRTLRLLLVEALSPELLRDGAHLGLELLKGVMIAAPLSDATVGGRAAISGTTLNRCTSYRE